MSINIRPVEKRDDVQLAALIRHTLTSFNANKPGTAFADAALDNMFTEFQAPLSAYWVVEQNGEILGGCGIYPTPGLPPGYCELVKLYLKDTERGKGLGKKLIDICFSAAIDKGFSTIYLETLPELHMAKPLYEKMGFIDLDKPVGQAVHYSCSIWMQKRLDVKN